MSDAWFDDAIRLFDAARGNDRFVKVRVIRHLLTAWRDARRLSPGTVVAPVVDDHTGLPPWSTWAEVLAEQRLGATLPPAPPDDAAVSSVDDARGRLRRREAAARALHRAPPLGLEAGRVDVRRVDGRRALVTVTLDRVSAAGLFVRLSADVSVVAGRDGAIIVDEDRARAAAPLIAALERSAALPAPAVAVQLAAIDDVVVERVTRGVVGPMVVGGRGRALAGHAGDDGAALALTFEELHGEVAAVSDNDLFATDDLQALWQALPSNLEGLKVFRDARVVATSAAAARLRALAARRGTKTVIQELPDSSGPRREP